MQHKAIRYGDEYQCSKCGKSWAVDDEDVPPCKQPSDYIKEMRDKLKKNTT